MHGEITDASLDAALTEAGLDPAAIRAGDGRSRGRRAGSPPPARSREKLAISGTPTFVFDNRMVRGYLPLEQMRGLVGELRAAD